MDNYTLIESYLMNVLSQDDKQAFELRMAQDDGFRNDVESHAKMKMAMNELVAHDVEKVIANSEVEKENSTLILNSELKNKEGNVKILKTDNSTSNKRRRIIGIAASLLVLGFVGWWGIGDGTGQTLNPDEAFDKFNNPLLPEDTRSGTAEESQKQETYFLEFREVDKLIQDAKYIEAYTKLKTMRLPIEHVLTDNRTWLLALVQLKIDPEKAKSDFSELAKYPEHKYAVKIEKLLKQLK